MRNKQAWWGVFSHWAIKLKGEKEMDTESMNAYHEEEERPFVERDEMERILKWMANYDGHPSNLKTQARCTLEKLNINY